MFSPKKMVLWVAAGVMLGLLYFLFSSLRSPLPRFAATRTAMVMRFITNPAAEQAYVTHINTRCEGAPFLFPTTGMVGYIWGDSFKIGQRHQGIDIFAGTDVGITPVVAASSGYLSREPSWVASVIIRVPNDPLHPNTQIWTYYTHMADAQGNSLIDPAYPPGTHEVWVEQGSQLGTQGNYSGDPANPVGVHLHFSVTKDDGSGKWLNELQIENTEDPSPYFGLRLNAASNPNDIPLCEPTQP